MTESNEHIEIAGSVDRIVAGEKIDLSQYDDETRRLLQLAAELSDGRPDPDEAFKARVEARIQELAASYAGGAVASGTRPASPAGGGSGHWLPGWLTFPRLAGAVALLLVGLSIAGLTGAVISGSGPGGIPESGLVTGRRTGDNSAPAAGSEDSVSGSEGGLRAFGDAAAPQAESLEAPATDSAVPGGSAFSTGAAPLPSEQRVIETADYSMEVPGGEFQQKFSDIRALADKYGGFVVSASTSKTGPDEPARGSITFRVANTGDNFSRVQAELDGIGTVISRNISGQDVTEEFVDLQSRLRNAESQAAQLLALMQKAQTVDEILMVQSRLAEVQAQIEQIKGRIQFMGSRTDFATISVSLSESGAADEEEDSGDTVWGFVDALKYAGWLAVQTVNFVLISLGVIIPAGLIAALIWMVVYRLWRRRPAGGEGRSSERRGDGSND